MRTETVIDTVALQCNFYKEDKCDIAKYEIIDRLKEYNFYSVNGIDVEFNYKPIATIDEGSFSYVTKDKKKANIVWYLSIKLAGLKKYIHDRDKASHNALMLIISYLNTNKIPFKVTQLDVALNIFTKYENTLVLCTKRHATTKYWKTNELQLFDTTKYIEKFKSAQHKADAVTHCCTYNKSDKEKLKYSLTRVEISFQKKFFKNNGFNVGEIYKEFYRYHMMHIPIQKIKQEIMDKYDRLDIIRQKDIKALKLDHYRLHIDLNVLVDFATKLYIVDNDVLDSFMI